MGEFFPDFRIKALDIPEDISFSIIDEIYVPEQVDTATSVCLKLINQTIFFIIKNGDILVDLFVKPDTEILNVIEKSIKKCDNNLLLFSKKIGICRTTIYHWFDKKCWIDIKKFQKICDYCGLDYLNYIQGKEVHSRRRNPEIFCNDWFKLNPNVALFLGWVCTEGYIPKNCYRIIISQKDPDVLKKLKLILEKEYPINNKIIIRERENGRIYVLEVYSSMLKYILVKHFGISEGKKNFIVSVPKQLFNASQKCKMAFLTASIEGDGSWPPDSINMRMTSKSYIKGCYRLLKDLGYGGFSAKLSQKDTWLVQLNSKRDICRFIYESVPYILAEKKLEYFFSKKFLKYYLYKNHHVGVDWRIVVYVRKKFNLTFRELKDLIETETGYSYSTSYLTDWVGYRKCRENLKIRLPILTLFSKILGKPEIIPEEYSWMGKAYKTKKFQNVKDIYDLRKNCREK